MQTLGVVLSSNGDKKSKNKLYIYIDRHVIMTHLIYISRLSFFDDDIESFNKHFLSVESCANSNHYHIVYSVWKKSCTALDDWTPNKIMGLLPPIYLSSGAGFLPSTVCTSMARPHGHCCLKRTLPSGDVSEVSHAESFDQDTVSFLAQIKGESHQKYPSCNSGNSTHT